MFPDRHDVVAPAAGMAAEVAVWLAGPAARPFFAASAQTAEDFERWQRIASPARREEWEVSRALLAHVRGSVGDVGGFSLSHSGGFAALAVGQRVRRVGVDLECTRRVRDVMRIAQFAFADSEVAQLEALPHEAREERFYILWTLKEAFAKASSLDLFACLRPCSFVEERGEWRGDMPVDGEWVARVFRPAPTLVLSVVAVAPNAGNCRVFVKEWPEEKSDS